MTLQILSSSVRKGLGMERKVNGKEESARILIAVTVHGSPGPIRFIVREEDLVSAVMSTALKVYAREGRRPILGCELDNFVLYNAFDGSLDLSPLKPIGSFGCRNFLLCKKPSFNSEERSPIPAKAIGKKGMVPWKAWLNKSFVRMTAGTNMAAGA